MKEHPIPQDVISYRFHIVGNMTLKQFLEIATGVVLAAIMYKMGLPGIIKWPFVVIFAATGAAAAFVPIAERPLDHWLTTYFKIMFKPTKYFWKKTAVIPALFNYQPNQNQDNQRPALNTAPIKRQRASEFVASIPQQKPSASDSKEEQKLKDVLSYFQNQTLQTDTLPKTASSTVTQPMTKTTPAPTPVVFASDDKKLPKAPVVNKQKSTGHEPSSAVQLASVPKITFSKNENNQEEKEVVQKPKQNLVYEAQAPIALEPPPDQSFNLPQVAKDLNPGVFNSTLPFPSAPTQPNTLVGMVLSQSGEMIPSAIVEIKNQFGQVERAVKSNALGQFFVTTPLKPSVYTIDVDAENFSFEPFTFETNNSFLPPLEIRSLN